MIHLSREGKTDRIWVARATFFMHTMTFRQYITLMAATTVLCLTAWFLVLFNIDPEYANAMSFIFFYASAFLSLFGIASMATCSILALRSEEPLFRLVRKSFYLAALGAGFCTTLLFLQGQKLIRLWTFVLLLAGTICLLGFFFISRKSQGDFLKQ